MLKVLSWNIQAGGGSRLRGIAKAIAASKSEIVILSEYRNNESGAKLRQLLLLAGYRYIAVTHALKNDNSVCIASKLSFDSELHPTSDEKYGANILSAHFAAFSVLGVYLPHKKKHKLFDFINSDICMSEKPYIIAGDYNSGINGVDQKGNSFWYEDDLKKMTKLEYLDAFRLVHEDAKEYSWYSHQKNGYRYDHTYIHSSLKQIIKDCYYEHSWREEKLSDHSAMVLGLG